MAVFEMNRAAMRDRAGDAVWAFLFMAVFIAAAAFNGTNDPLVALFMPLLCLGAGATLLDALRKGRALPAGAPIAALSAFCLYLAVSTFWSSVPYISKLFALLFASLPLTVLTIAAAGDPRRRAFACGAGVACGWIGLACWALLQFFVLPDTAGRRISGPMLDPNNMAALFNMGLLPAAAWFIQARGRKAAVPALAAYCLLFTALIATQSRAGLAIACVCLAGLGVLSFPMLRRAWWKLPLGAILPFLIYKAVNHKSGGMLDKSFVELTYSTSASVIDRRSLWTGGLRMLKDHPFGDIGLGNFYYYYPAYRSPQDLSDGFFLHLDPLQLVLETGPLCGVLFYAFLIAVLAGTVQAWRILPPGGGARAVLAGSFAGLLSLALHSHINYNLYLPGILVPAGTLLACWYLAARSAGLYARAGIPPFHGWKRRAAVAGAVALFAVMAVWPVRVGLSSVALDRVNRFYAAGERDKAERLALSTVRWGPHDNFTAYEMLARLKMEDAKAGHATAESLRRGMAWIERARLCNPVFTAFNELQAQFYFMGRGGLYPDGEARAEALLEEALARNPLELDAREGLAVVRRSQGRNAEALSVLEEGLAWPRPKGAPDLAFLNALASARLANGDRQGHDEMVSYIEEKAKEYGWSVERQ